MGTNDKKSCSTKEIKPSKENQAMAEYIAVVVRHAMENFHCEHLTDAQMKELNPVIRNAICSALHAFENRDKYKNAERFFNFSMNCIPDYWEKAEIDDFLKRLDDFQD